MTATGDLARDVVGVDARPYDPGTPVLGGAGGELTAPAVRRHLDQVVSLVERAGLGPGDLLGIPADRSPRTVLAVWGALAARVPFTLGPADGSGPAVRPYLRAWLESPAGVEEPGWEPRLRAEPVAPAGRVPDGTAYVLTTSGTGSTPRATAVGRDGLAQVFSGVRHQLRDVLPEDATWTAAHALTFGFSMFELLGALAFRGRLVVVEDRSPFTSGAWTRAVAAAPGAVVAAITPSELTVLCGRAGRLEPVGAHLYLVLSGEPAHRAPLRRLLGQTSPEWLTVINTYAATETSGQIAVDVVTARTLDRTIAGYVGRELPGVRVECGSGPDDVQEIVVGGPTVALGYLNDPGSGERREPADERFHGEGEGRSFHTRDLGYRDGDGSIVVVGRAEGARKIAGRWFDMDEAERRVRALDGIADALCAVRPVELAGASLEVLLFAVVPVDPPATVAARLALRRRVAEALPAPVPLHLAIVDALPRTERGKLDRRALHALADPGVEPPAPGGEPGTDEVESALIQTWGQTLGLRIPRDHNLFDLGLDSLTVTVVATALTTRLARTVTPEFLFTYPTLTEQLAALRPAASPPAPRPRPRPGAATASDVAGRRRAARADAQRRTAP